MWTEWVFLDKGIPSRTCLPRLLTQHHGLRADEPECINDHLALDTLDRVDHHRHGALVEGLKALGQRSEDSIVNKQSVTASLLACCR